MHIAVINFFKIFRITELFNIFEPATNPTWFIKINFSTLAPMGLKGDFLKNANFVIFQGI